MSWDSSSGPQHGTPGSGESLNKFSFEDLQKFTLHYGVIRNALLALGDTSRAMRRMKAYYEDRRTIFEFTHSEAVASFLRELDSLAETVGIAEEQLRMLSSELDQHLELVSDKACVPVVIGYNSFKR